MKASEIEYTSIEQCVRIIKMQETLLDKMEETKNLLLKLCAVKDERIELYQEWVRLLKGEKDG